MSSEHTGWARARLERAYREIPDLLAGENEVTAEFEEWCAGIKRALESAFGDRHPFTRDFSAWTMVHTGYLGVPGRPETWDQITDRTPPHDILRQATGLLEDALAALQAGEVAAASTPSNDLQRNEGTPVDQDDTTGDAPTAFVSYARESKEHEAWVRTLASRLREAGVDVKLDQWEVAPGDQLPEFMERAVRENEHILIVCTPTYRQKSEARAGGVGYEGDIMTGAAFTDRDKKKFIPVLRAGDAKSSIPNWLGGRYYVDLSGNPYDDGQYQDLVTTLLGTREQAPPLGQARQQHSGARADQRSRRNTTVESTAARGHDAPIRILGIVVDAVGTPKNDGTAGSALYRIPFQLSGQPTREWAALFIETWNRPPRFTSMHRPGIARVEGDRVILDGTTVEEVERFHRDTLVAVTRRVNEIMAEHQADQERREEELARNKAEHEREVRERALRISFDD